VQVGPRRALPILSFTDVDPARRPRRIPAPGGPRFFHNPPKRIWAGGDGRTDRRTRIVGCSMKRTLDGSLAALPRTRLPRAPGAGAADPSRWAPPFQAAAFGRPLSRSGAAAAAASRRGDDDDADGDDHRGCASLSGRSIQKDRRTCSFFQTPKPPFLPLAAPRRSDRPVAWSPADIVGGRRTEFPSASAAAPVPACQGATREEKNLLGDLQRRPPRRRLDWRKRPTPLAGRVPFDLLSAAPARRGAEEPLSSQQSLFLCAFWCTVTPNNERTYSHRYCRDRDLNCKHDKRNRGDSVTVSPPGSSETRTRSC
jgi:hypothetical protein